MRLGRGGPPPGVEPLPTRNRSSSPSQVPVERLRLTVMRRIDGLLAGDHGGLFPGHGTEMGEARPYVPGDDPRRMDWAVTARHDEPHVRESIADHELDVWLVLDTSASLAFGTGLATKYEVAWSALGAMALLASTGGNRVGAVGTHVRERTGRPLMLPARGGAGHVSTVLAALRPEPVDGQVGDLSLAFGSVRRLARRRGMVVVASDFLGESGWERPLRALGRTHEVIAIEVVDPREMSLPDVGLIAVVDPETGDRRLLDTARRSIRDSYRSLAVERRAGVAATLKSVGADHLTLRTDGDWVIDFVRFVSSRKSRLVSARRPRP